MTELVAFVSDNEAVIGYVLRLIRAEAWDRVILLSSSSNVLSGFKKQVGDRAVCMQINT